MRKVIFVTPGRPLYIVYNCTSEIKISVHHKENKAGSLGFALYFFNDFNLF